jgi:hypothetical protein
MKMIREGMEDYEYLKLLSDLGGAAEAQQIAQHLFPHAYQADVSAADLMAARQAIASAILTRSGKPVPSAAGTSSTASSLQASPGGAGGCGANGSRGTGLLALAIVPLGLLARRSRRRT